MPKEYYNLELDNNTIIKVISVGGSSINGDNCMDDDIIRQGIRSISDIVNDLGYVNLDLNDVKKIMSNAGQAYMCIGEATGDNAPVVAIRKAVNSTLLERNIHKARSIIINFVGDAAHLNMMDLNEATESIASQAHPKANILWGVSVDDILGNAIRVVAVTGNFE